MATIIQIKRSSGTTAPSSLKLGELAYTYGTGTQGNNGDRLFLGIGGVDGNGDANEIAVIGGQYFQDKLDHVDGTLTASSAITVDSNKAIDEIFIGNNATTGGTLKLNEGTNNGTNFIGLKAPNSVTSSTTFTLPDGDGSTGQFLKTDGSGNLSFGTVTTSLTLRDDSSTVDTFNTGEILTFSGGANITGTISDNTITYALDTTLTGLTSVETETLTNDSGNLIIDSATNIVEIRGDGSSVVGQLQLNCHVNSHGQIIASQPHSEAATNTLTLPGGNTIGNSDATLVSDTGTQTLTNKTISGSNNTLSNISNSSLSNSTITVTGDSGTQAIDLGDTLTVSGDTGITTTVSGDSISIDLDDTAVTPGSYGSTSAIPVLTVDQQGRITAASTASISTSLTIADETSTTTTIDLANDTLKITGGEGINSTISGDTISISGEDASDTNKGIASFDATDFTVSSGDVTLNTERVQDIAGAMFGSNTETLITATYQDADGTIDLVVDNDLSNYDNSNSAFITASSTDTLTNKTINASQLVDGSVSNAKLANSSVTIGSDSVSLGATQTDLNGITSLDVDNITIDGNTISTTDANGDLVLDPNGSGDVDVNNSKIINVSTPTADNDAANKAYVDGVVNGLDVKESVQLATTGNLTATYDNGAGTLTANSNGALSVDGVTPSVDDRILVKDQSTQTQNGIYKVTTVGDGSTAFVLTRSPDADTASELTGGTFFFVEAGTANADNGYVATHNGTPTFGSTNITFSQFSGAGQISAGDALTKTGNQLDVAVDDSSIEVSSDALQVKALGITNAMLAGSIENAKLSNSSISIGGVTFNLGDTDATPALDLSDATNYPTSSLSGTIANNQLANSTISFSDDSSTVSDIDLGTTLAINGGEGIDATISGDTITIAGELATTSNIGVASFNAANFAVSSGDVTVTTVDGGTF